MSTKIKVLVRLEELVIPTYLPRVPDKNPMFLEKRVYQGSSGRVYPLPFTDRIAEIPVERKWKAVWLENEWIQVLILPELGGRIHAILDKTNGYDVIYRQQVIKPALVGLAGPWISGGIEFNWPQHHRPATFLPVDFHIEEHADGSMTVWCSDHDPMCRMKGMHGVTLHPNRNFVELKVRAYNRTQFAHTFLWWANVATCVHEMYQSFFPPDVNSVADHAKRAISQYPLARSCYYGVDYGQRQKEGIPENEVPKQFKPPHCVGSPPLHPAPENACQIPNYSPNDLSFYANIPVPTSYMCIGSGKDFFGGYDYKAQAGIVHVANHHISPGKKQWTWGNHDFGYAWDRNLTDPDQEGVYRPYIEIMAGVYTDNQPDFSYLQPGETKTWSQFWYPIQQIGPAQHANLDAAVSLNTFDERIRLGICVTQEFSGARIILSAKGRELLSECCELAPGRPFIKEIGLPRLVALTDLRLLVTTGRGKEIIAFQPKLKKAGKLLPPATEPPAPREISSTDELFITGLHLQQYRHATRCPTIYWREALRRDPLDSRCNNALGLWHLNRGEFPQAERLFRNAIKRLTRRNPNPYDGEPFYNLGLCLRHQFDSNPQPASGNRQWDEAYAMFYKATWNQAWAASGYHALAEMDCRHLDWQTALDHLNHSLRLDTDNLRARNLKTMVLRRLKWTTEAAELLTKTLDLDPLDWWGRHLAGAKLACDLQVHLDLAHDYARAGFFDEAIKVLLQAEVAPRDLPDQSLGAQPLIQYTLGWLHRKAGDRKSERSHFRQAAKLPPEYCFPARLEEIAILQSAMHLHPDDSQAPFYLGNLFYDRRRHADAIKLWERSAKLNPNYSVVWRNLGIAYFNILRQPARARMAYDRAFQANPTDARLLFERDQLWKRLGEKPDKRLRELQKHSTLVDQRDDLSIELCALYNQTGQHAQALQLLASRRFQPWEGGEGLALEQHVRTHLALGRAAVARRGLEAAEKHFQDALKSPENLGEARHLLANQSDAHYWLGISLSLSGDLEAAQQHWLAAATFKGDFQEMSVRHVSEKTYFSAMAWRRLGQKSKAKRLLRNLLAAAKTLRRKQARIDYFATSLPNMLLFEDDIQFRQETAALFLQAQAYWGLGDPSRTRRLLADVLERDPNHAGAADLLEETVSLTHLNHVARNLASNGAPPKRIREPLAVSMA